MKFNIGAFIGLIILISWAYGAEPRHFPEKTDPLVYSGTSVAPPEWRGIAFAGNTYDIALPWDPEISVYQSRPGVITRLAYLDPDGDLCFVEFSGSGLVNVSWPGGVTYERPAHYAQDQTYPKGRPQIDVYQALNDTRPTWISVYALGTDPTRVDASLVRDAASIDGVADVAYVNIQVDYLGDVVNLANCRIDDGGGYGALWVLAHESGGRDVYVHDLGPALGDLNLRAPSRPYSVYVVGGALSPAAVRLGVPYGHAVSQHLEGVRYIAGQDACGRVQPAGVNKTKFNLGSKDVTAEVVK